MYSKYLNYLNPKLHQNRKSHLQDYRKKVHKKLFLINAAGEKYAGVLSNVEK